MGLPQFRRRTTEKSPGIAFGVNWGERRNSNPRSSRFIRFCQNLLIPFDFSRLRQIVIINSNLSSFMLCLDPLQLGSNSEEALVEAPQSTADFLIRSEEHTS